MAHERISVGTPNLQAVQRLIDSRQILTCARGPDNLTAAIFWQFMAESQRAGLVSSNWAQQDSNLRPTGYEPVALTN